MPRKKKEEASRPPAKHSPGKKETKPKAVSKKSASLLPKRARKTAVSVEPLKETLPAASKAGSFPTPALPKKSHSPASSSPGSLPRNGETQVIAFVRDPSCIYAYWEVAPSSVEEARKKLGDEFKNSSMVLRLFRVDGTAPAEVRYEAGIEPGSMNRYLEVEGEGQSYFVEVGQKTASGKYIPYARSRTLTPGVNKPSAAVDPQWVPSPQMEKYYEEEALTHSMPGPSSAQTQQVRKTKWRPPHSSSQH